MRENFGMTLKRKEIWTDFLEPDFREEPKSLIE